MLHSRHFITLCGQNVLIQHERKRWTLMQLANSMFHSYWSRASHLLLTHHFSSSTNDLKMNMITVKYLKNFNDFVVSNDF